MTPQEREILIEEMAEAIHLVEYVTAWEKVPETANWDDGYYKEGKAERREQAEACLLVMEKLLVGEQVDPFEEEALS